MRTIVLSDCGHCSRGPSGVLSQSSARMRAPISPPPLRKSTATKEFGPDPWLLIDVIVSCTAAAHRLLKLNLVKAFELTRTAGQIIACRTARDRCTPPRPVYENGNPVEYDATKETGLCWPASRVADAVLASIAPILDVLVSGRPVCSHQEPEPRPTLSPVRHVIPASSHDKCSPRTTYSIRSTGRS